MLDSGRAEMGHISRSQRESVTEDLFSSPLFCACQGRRRPSLRQSRRISGFPLIA